jgi:glycosyltransferase involved in cell wall biosynthesis
MRVVQAVFGVFHHFELAHQLHRRNDLERIYSTWPWARLKREGLPRELVRTFPILHTSEYLLSRSGRVPGEITAKLASWNALAFDRYTASKIDREECDAFIAISGAGLLTGARVQQRGGKFLCDRGSTHQRFQEAVVLEEYKRWGVPLPLAKPHIAIREEAIYAQADAITVPSTVAKRSFIQMGIAAEKVHVIPYGVRLDKFTPIENSRHSERSEESPHFAQSGTNATFNLLFAGGVSIRKGVPYLLEAFARLNHPRKYLTIVGSISPEVRPLLRRLPTDNVTFTGSVSQSELAKRMGASHALVLPSIEEGLALVQGQAMACGCPVISSVATGAEDLFTDGIEGFIVPERDVVALTARMQQLADDPSLQKSMSAAALARVKTLGGWDDYGDRWQNLLRTVAGHP